MKIALTKSQYPERFPFSGSITQYISADGAEGRSTPRGFHFQEGELVPVVTDGDHSRSTPRGFHFQEGKHTGGKTLITGSQYPERFPFSGSTLNQKTTKNNLLSRSTPRGSHFQEGSVEIAGRGTGSRSTPRGFHFQEGVHWLWRITSKVCRSTPRGFHFQEDSGDDLPSF